MHTEGDWKVEGLEVVSFGHGVIARCPTPNVGGGVMECTENVHLLAASKKLLAACEAAKDYLNTSSKLDWDNIITPILDAAIAEAGGE